MEGGAHALCSDFFAVALPPGSALRRTFAPPWLPSWAQRPDSRPCSPFRSAASLGRPSPLRSRCVASQARRKEGRRRSRRAEARGLTSACAPSSPVLGHHRQRQGQGPFRLSGLRATTRQVDTRLTRFTLFCFSLARARLVPRIRPCPPPPPSAALLFLALLSALSCPAVLAAASTLPPHDSLAHTNRSRTRRASLLTSSASSSLESSSRMAAPFRTTSAPALPSPLSSRELLADDFLPFSITASRRVRPVSLHTGPGGRMTDDLG